MSEHHRLGQLQEMVSRLEGMPSSTERDWMLAEVRARAVDVDTNVRPAALRKLPTEEARSDDAQRFATSKPARRPPARRGAPTGRAAVSRACHVAVAGDLYGLRVRGRPARERRGALPRRALGHGPHRPSVGGRSARIGPNLGRGPGGSPAGRSRSGPRGRTGGTRPLGGGATVIGGRSSDRRPQVSQGSLGREVVIANRRFTDLFAWGQRSVALSLAAEIQHRLLPGSYTCEAGQFTLAAWPEPAGNVGGDTFDFALERDTLHLSMTDAMGHEVEAAELATVLVGALRNARRAGVGLAEQAGSANTGLANFAKRGGFVTGQLARVDLRAQTATIVNAGHPSTAAPPQRARRAPSARG